MAEQEWTDWDDLTPEQQQSILDAPCRMFHQEPFDFAWCETHDTTFPLGSICEYHHQEETP
jgi:hypothetical protein